MSDMTLTAVWFTIVGLLLVGMAVAGSRLERLPITTSLVYLAVGAALGPVGAGLITLDPVDDAKWLEHVSEVAVLVSLFASGLKLRTAFTDRRWHLPVRLATSAMVVTIALVTLVGVYVLRLPLGAAVLLGAVLAPTDPVLASDVQVAHVGDRDRLRFALTGEAALNDGTAFPFVMLGLGLLGVHELGPFGARWIGIDLVWAVASGVGAGAALGWAVSRFVLHLRRTRKEAVGLDDLLALGLIALAYGVALLIKGYGFLAVFAAGFALRRVEHRESMAQGAGDAPPDVRLAAQASTVPDEKAIATAPETAPAYMAEAALGVTEQLERMLEAVVVVLLGGMLLSRPLAPEVLWFAPLLFLVLRPLAVRIAAPMRSAPPIQRRLVQWFGIRGIGSVYYLSFATAHGLPRALAERLVPIVLATIAASALVHGLSVTPLMGRYGRASEEGRGA